MNTEAAYEVHIHRHHGHDEYFEFDTLEEAEKEASELRRDSDTRRVEIRDENGWIINDWPSC
jgi:hypothetical protein